MKGRVGDKKGGGNTKEGGKLEERGDPAVCGGFPRFCSFAKQSRAIVAL